MDVGRRICRPEFAHGVLQQHAQYSSCLRTHRIPNACLQPEHSKLSVFINAMCSVFSQVFGRYECELLTLGELEAFSDPLIKVLNVCSSEATEAAGTQMILLQASTDSKTTRQRD